MKKDFKIFIWGDDYPPHLPTPPKLPTPPTYAPTYLLTYLPPYLPSSRMTQNTCMHTSPAHFPRTAHLHFPMMRPQSRAAARFRAARAATATSVVAALLVDCFVGRVKSSTSYAPHVRRCAAKALLSHHVRLVLYAEAAGVVCAELLPCGHVVCAFTLSVCFAYSCPLQLGEII